MSEVTLTFERMDNPNRRASLNASRKDNAVDYVARAGKQLGLTGRVALATPAGTPIEFVGKTVGQLVEQAGTNNFRIGTPDMLGG